MHNAKKMLGEREKMDNKSKNNKMQSGKALRWIIKKMCEYDKFLYVLIFLYSVSATIYVLAFTYIPKIILQLVSEKAEIDKTLIVTGAFGLTIIISKYLSEFSTEYCNAEYNKFRLRIIAEMGKRFIKQPFEYLESTTFLDKSQKSDVAVQGCSPGLEASVKSLTMIGVHFATCISSLIAISMFQPVLIVFILIIVLCTRTLNKLIKKQEKELVDSSVSAERKAEYYFDIMSDFRYGKEIRVYQFHYWIRDCFKRLSEVLRNIKNEILNKNLIVKMLISVLAFVQLILVYFYATKSVLEGHIDIGSYLTYIGLVSVFATSMNQLMDDTIEFQYHGMFVNDLISFFEMMDYEEKGGLSLKDINLSNWQIEFQNVSFHYPNQKKNVINNLSLTIHKGDKIAITGLNGAGKTTMIKLLTRLYDPTDGQILLNGIDIREFDRKELYSLFAPMFQDVFMFAFSVKENISLEPKEKANEQLMWDKLSMVGLKEKIESLPNKLDTSCLTLMDLDGVQFSGGQQQRLILARTLYKNRDFFIFDEPTAALDSLTEDMIYQEFYKMTEGKTAIFITHRLASTKFCDCIYVLNQGKIVQKGTHSELMNEEGEYQQLYELQNKNYREENAE